jgi:hypothetical protein
VAARASVSRLDVAGEGGATMSESLEPRALDARIAELLGWEWWQADVSGVPHFSTDIAAAHLLGDMLYDRGLWQPYIEALIDITGAGMTMFTTAIEIDVWAGDAWRSLYHLVQATPFQCALAALAALRALEASHPDVGKDED